MMLVGIMADTHDRLPMVDKAVKKLKEEEVELVLHAGDYIAPFVVPHFKPLKADLIGVFGNNDGDKELLKEKFSDMGADIRGNFAEILIDGLKIAMLHGHEEELLRSLIDADSYDVVVHGHMHEAKSYRKRKTLVINPGEVCGYLTGKSTIALLDTKALDVKIIPLK
ncbi:MAG: metallophosphoesterase [Candidatus Bathyarchaeota archaeon]|nr:metallophosphoesterase [Candidatus Bathyarchaeota archaeon]MDH5779795.1 metallophosphoesterase [Candidatus Bathyarchaeota archaeon]